MAVLFLFSKHGVSQCQLISCIREREPELKGRDLDNECVNLPLAPNSASPSPHSSSLPTPPNRPDETHVHTP